MHAQLDALRGAPRDAEQLDAVAELLGVADVRARKLFDSFPEAFLELHRDAEGERRQDGELVRGVDALDVEARIGFGVAAPLRFAEGGREIEAAVAHLGRMKLDVPLMMPAIHSMRFAARPSRSALMIGMPPPT